MTRFTPASANASAQPRPKPLLDAQTKARFPLIPRSICCLSIFNQSSAKKHGAFIHVPHLRVILKVWRASRGTGVKREMSAVVMFTQKAEKPAYFACPSQAFRAEFGVCRGEAISRFEDLNLGDIYQLKQTIDWAAVTPLDDGTEQFALDLAANLPPKQLKTLASLIFMTTTGQRTDVFATVAAGQLYLVCQKALVVGPEYVLIDIETNGVAIAPTLVSDHVAPKLSSSIATPARFPIRMHG
jgi:hypothetical protein